VTIAIIARHTLLEFDMGEVGNQLRENGSANIHPPVFRRSAEGSATRFKSPLSSVFSSNRFLEKRRYATDGKVVIGFRKALYRTLVI
jgi:hypothetical protein